MKIADFLYGWFGTIFDNELEVVSTKQDPPKLRFAVDEDKVESNLGGVSFNHRRADGNHEEWGIVMGRKTADGKAGGVYIACRDRESEQVKEVAYFHTDAVSFTVPIVAPNLTGGSVSAPADTLRSANGRMVLALQGDGNLVLYVDNKPVKALFGLSADRLW